MNDTTLNQILDEVAVKSYYHARPCTNLINKVKDYASEYDLSDLSFYVAKLEDISVNEVPEIDWINAFSITQLMLLNIHAHDVVGIKLEGPYENGALQECMDYVKGIFGDKYRTFTRSSE